MGRKKTTQEIVITQEMVENMMKERGPTEAPPAPVEPIVLKPKHLRVLLSNPINDFTFTFMFASIEEKLKRLKKLYIYLDSPGGCARTMRSIIAYIDSLKSYGVEVVTIAMNQVASAALPIFMCGDTRYCIGTEFMQHYPFFPHLSDSTHEDLAYDADSIKKDLDYVVKYSTRGSKLTPGQFLAMINSAHRKTLEFGPEEAYDWGILTHNTPPPRVGGPLIIIKEADEDNNQQAKKR